MVNTRFVFLHTWTILLMTTVLHYFYYIGISQVCSQGLEKCVGFVGTQELNSSLLV